MIKSVKRSRSVISPTNVGGKKWSCYQIFFITIVVIFFCLLYLAKDFVAQTPAKNYYQITPPPDRSDNLDGPPLSTILHENKNHLNPQPTKAAQDAARRFYEELQQNNILSVNKGHPPHVTTFFKREDPSHSSPPQHTTQTTLRKVTPPAPVVYDIPTINHTNIHAPAVLTEELELKIDPHYLTWKENTYSKLVCLKNKKAAFYLYHVRKAAGTTIRDMMKLISFRSRVPFYESEGMVLHQPFLEMKQLFTIISFRDPISRIISLYWYEHVSWFHSIVKKPEKIKSMEAWIDAWKDRSPYKSSILEKFPANNYVEISNYYVKLLIGYNYKTDGVRPLTREDLEKAKEILRKFDLIFISEWMNDEEENNLLLAFHKQFYTLGLTYHQAVIPTKIKGDRKMRDTLGSKYASNEVSYCFVSFLLSR
jgi:hypothetical protein